jgi:hypothetical protein
MARVDRREMGLTMGTPGRAELLAERADWVLIPMGVTGSMVRPADSAPRKRSTLALGAEVIAVSAILRRAGMAASTAAAPAVAASLTAGRSLKVDRDGKAACS